MKKRNAKNESQSSAKTSKNALEEFRCLVGNSSPYLIRIQSLQKSLQPIAMALLGDNTQAVGGLSAIASNFASIVSIPIRN